MASIAVPWLQKILTYGKMIKFSHTLFLMPFALSALLLAPSGYLKGEKLFWIFLALVCARSAAMGFNRIVDCKLDACNPRTAERALPAGLIGLGEAWGFVIISCGIFLLSTSALNRLAFMLSPLALVLILGYSFTKRFTWISHLILGLATSLAPAGTWVALTGTLELRILPLVFSVALWVAGFDVLYACQDVQFDRRWGLSSVPVRFGVGNALRFARVLHGLSMVGLLWVGILFGLEGPYKLGLLIIGALLLVEHSLVSEGNLSRIDQAFFTVNGMVSGLYLLAVLVDTRWL